VKWILFNGLLIALLSLDFYAHRKKEMTTKESLKWTGFWVLAALIFNGFLGFWYGSETALDFFTGYLIEKSLSVDNLFIFVLLFNYFQIDSQHQSNVLLVGVISALIMRLIFILVGVSLIKAFHWLIYVFGALLLLASLTMLFEQKEKKEIKNNLVLKLLKRFIPIKEDAPRDRYFVYEGGKRYATPLFATLVMIEATDLLFAFDSIPAIFGVTLDPFIVYTSNAFAILGLRALYFALHDLLRYFKYLHHGVCAILFFVGSKMLFSGYIKIPNLISLAVIATILIISIVVSLWKQKNSSTS
jgi:tellurite resistance protein TerC